MGVTEDIKTMIEEGKTEQEIISSLQSHGMNAKEIADYLAQAKIKQAVAAPDAELPEMEQAKMTSQAYASQGMEPSVLITGKSNPSQQKKQSHQQNYANYQTEDEAQESQNLESQDYQASDYGAYDPYQSSFSPDMITEISEQVVAERLSALRSKIDSILDIKILLESKIAYVDERLKRIENVIDRLQLSVLQKVGEYVANVEDLKSELLETQKSFKSLLSEKHK